MPRHAPGQGTGNSELPTYVGTHNSPKIQVGAQVELTTQNWQLTTLRL